MDSIRACSLELRGLLGDVIAGLCEGIRRQSSSPRLNFGENRHFRLKMKIEMPHRYVQCRCISSVP